MKGYPIAGASDARRSDAELDKLINEAEYQRDFPTPADDDQLDRAENRYVAQFGWYPAEEDDHGDFGQFDRHDGSDRS